ncbi:unnamed protein product [Meganyctiphanes norvegica]|uniref:SET domain-containing protein n=1 Tax=Meganyctiphanes norvegica TaxID=48144 RepID=A0AAV2QN08_MEGNR
MVTSDVCGECGAAAGLTCGGCGNIKYCDKDHQRRHWKIHKNECRPIKEIDSTQFGRYMVATRDIERGQLLMKESPYLVGPTATSDLICLTCHGPVLDNNIHFCPGCKWPLCCKECVGSSTHAEECTILASDKKGIGPPKGPGANPRYDLILVIRALLLREKDSKGWSMVESLANHTEQRMRDKEPHHMAAVRFCSEMIEPSFEADLVHKVHGAIITNCINTHGARGETLRCLYPTIPRLNHSCQPNVTLRSDDDNVLFVRAAVDIKKGEPLVFNYNSALDPVWQRQSELENIYYFTCVCGRCSDPTEMGTHFSSPRCPDCKKGGYIEPIDGPDKPWKCSKCSKERDATELIREAEEAVADIEEKKEINPKYAQKMMDKYTDLYHSTHYVWSKAATSVLRHLRGISGRGSLTLRRDLQQGILKLLDIFEPGYTRRRGVTLYEAAVVEISAARSDHAAKRLLNVELMDAHEKALEMLDESVTILGLEPPHSTEVVWLERARVTRKTVEDSLTALKNKMNLEKEQIMAIVNKNNPGVVKIKPVTGES